MKDNIKFILVLAFWLFFSALSFAQIPPHPNGGGGPGGGNTPVGGGAPIDGGLTIILILGGAYASKKIYGMKQ
jgi:hypothetical protein